MTEKTKNIVLPIFLAALLFGMALFCWLKPAQASSDSERRKLAQMPEVSRSGVVSGAFMRDFEAYTLDQFPLRDRFRTLKAEAARSVFRKLDNNGLYLSGGYLSAMEYPIDDASIAWAGERLAKLCDDLAGTDVKTFFCIIPDKNYWLAPPAGRLSMDYSDFCARMQAALPDLRYINIFDDLELADYYRTDTHWRQERLMPAARKIASAMGVELTASYTEKTLPQPFYGVYAAQAALPVAGEPLTYLTNETLEQCRVYDWQNDREIAVYDLERAAGQDPYELFLSGSLSLVTIENPNNTSGRELVIFRDSFASSIAPLFAEAYSKITLVDPRYLSGDYLGRFVTFDDQDVLFLFSTLVLNDSFGIK